MNNVGSCLSFNSYHILRAQSLLDFLFLIYQQFLESIKHVDKSVRTQTIIRLGGLDLDSLKKDILTVEIFSTVWKTTSQQLRFSWQFKKQLLNKSWQSLCYKVSICLNFYLCLDQDSRSRHFKNRYLNCRENIDSLKMDISTCPDITISILIALDCRLNNYLLKISFLKNKIICNDVSLVNQSLQWEPVGCSTRIISTIQIKQSYFHSSKKW